MVEKPPKLWACQGLEVTIQAFKVFGAGAGTPAWTAPAVPRPSGLTQRTRRAGCCRIVLSLAR